MKNFPLTTKAGKLLKYWDLILLTIFILAYSLTFSQLSILRHNAFASNYDLANMSQTVWNTLHGRPFALSGAEGTISRFSIHADLILILISPLYFIWERAITLLLIQSFALGLGAIPVYFLTKKVLGSLKNLDATLIKFVSLTMSLIYLLNPDMEWTNMYDFHGVALAIPLLLTVFYFAFIKKWLWFWIFTLIALTTKEEVSLLIAGLGLAIIFVFKEKLVGSLTFILGIVWFLLVVFIIIPHFSPTGVNWGISDLYFPALERISKIHNISQFFGVFNSYFLSGEAINYYATLIKPFSFVPIFGLPWLILATPEFAINLLSSNALMRSLTLHYDSGITPFVIIAAIFGLKYFLNFLNLFKPLRKFEKYILILITIGMLAVALRENYHYSPLPTTPSCWCILYNVTQDDIDFARVLSEIPPNASVTSSGEIRAHLTKRENSFTLPGDVDTADYVAILDENRIVGDYSPKEFEGALLKDPKFLSSHTLISHIGHFWLFKKK